MSKSLKTLLGFALLGFVGVWMGCSSDTSPVAPQAAGKTHLTAQDPVVDLSEPDDPTTTPVAFADSSLERAVGEALVTAGLFAQVPSSITVAQMDSLTTLNASGRGIQSLAGLDYATNLNTLNLNNNKISDLSPLSYLTSLTSLNLNNNKISDLSSLASLTNLTHLNLYANSIADVRPLASLTNLTSLQIGENHGISDMSPLASLTNLTHLKMRGSGIDNAELQTFSGLTNLTWLNLASNPITNLYPLTCLPNLKKLLLRKVIPDHIDTTNVHVLYLKAREPAVKVSWDY